MHYFKHSRDEFLQDFSLFGDDFICHLFRQRQDALHPIEKNRGHLVILVLFLQQLNPQSVTSRSDSPMTRTNLKCDLGNTKDSLCNWVQLTGVNSLLALCGYGTTDLRENNAIFNRVVYHSFCRSGNEWGVLL